MNNINEIKKGHKEFKSIKFKQNEDRFKRLVEEGQSPKALFIGCSDSRVMPAMITGSGAGDLFVMRNIGNFVPPFKPDTDFHATAAAIEYATSHLEVTDIIVCGHSDCGAIKALYKSPKATPENIHTIKWLELGAPAKQVAGEQLKNCSQEELLSHTEKLSVTYQLKNLLTYPAVARGVDEGTLYLHGWHYEISSGEIAYYDNESCSFKPLEEKR